ncbi:adapter-related protein [Cardiosporidium cionae]|uniref:Adapter-related protein n=1 Tax=Cardiosporidium cionae TaxID=476202 RepID=A0ABQ7JD73_9APIC|nr:adapter-related protein [Cardiosporidium cionae]|eukprot:KAF8821991.1 adapter-related protein [Cardiosporidium cionae]
MNISSAHLSRDFFEFVKSVGEARSKQDEDRIILLELDLLKGKFSEPNLSARRMRENILRVIYCEMLGHNAAIHHIHAVKLVHDKIIATKRLGYLACKLLLRREDELTLLLINTMQKDLISNNKLVVLSVLSCICSLLNSELVPSLIPAIRKLLSHDSPHIRKKSCMVLHAIFFMAPDVVKENKDCIIRALCDDDPAVMGASLHVLHELAQSNPQEMKEIIPSLVNILKQICDRRLPRTYDYHRVPAPWLQIKLLSLLATLGCADRSSSEKLYDILQHVMRITDTASAAGYAILYECVKTISTIYPSHSLLEQAAASISRFILSGNNNLKYVGVTGLAIIVQVNPSYATHHQLAVVDCLEDPDETLKRRTLELLYKMTNSKNVVVVCEKLLEHLRSSEDTQLRRDLASKVTELAERFSPENTWYLETLTKVLDVAGNLVDKTAAYNLLQLVAEGPTGDIQQDELFRKSAVNMYVKLCWEDRLFPDILMQVIAWILGEYGMLYESKDHTMEDIVDGLCDTLDRNYETVSTRGWILSAIMKLCARSKIRNSSYVRDTLQRFRNYRNSDIQQRCSEAIQLLSKEDAFLEEVLPYDASAEDIDVDERLSFLNHYVRCQTSYGEKSYIPHEQRKKRIEDKKISIPTTPLASLNFKPYELPPKPAAELSLSRGQMPAEGATIFNANRGEAIKDRISHTVPQRWGPSGYSQRGDLKKSLSDTSKQELYPHDTKYLQPIDTAEGLASLPLTSDPLAKTFRENLSTSPVANGRSDNASDSSFHSPYSEREKMAAALFNGVPVSTPLNTLNALTNKWTSLRKTVAPLLQPPPSLSKDVINLPISPCSSSERIATPSEICENHPVHSSISSDLLFGISDESKPVNEGGELDDLFMDTAPASIEKRDPKLEESPLEDFLEMDFFENKSQALPSLSPHVCDTAQVEKVWDSLHYEVRETLPFLSKRLPCALILQSLVKRLNMSLVHCIAEEGIIIGKSLLTNALVLVYCKSSASYAEIIVKSSQERLANELLSFCRQLLGELSESCNSL